MIADAIILAAGASTRLGRPKQLLRFGGRSLLQRTIAAVRGAPVRRVVVVLGAAAPRIREHIAADDVELVENVDWPAGMGGSIAAGMRALGDEPDAVLVTLCDQPLLSSAHIVSLIALVRQSQACIVASRYGEDTFGAPVVFTRAVFGELRALPPSSGAKAVIGRHWDVTELAPFADGAIDIDTEGDYRRLLAIDGGMSPP